MEWIFVAATYVDQLPTSRRTASCTEALLVSTCKVTLHSLKYEKSHLLSIFTCHLAGNVKMENYSSSPHFRNLRETEKQVCCMFSVNLNYN